MLHEPHSTIFIRGCCVLQDAEGRSALSWTASKGQFDVVVVLLEHLANISLQDHKQMTPLMYAVEAGHMDVATKMLEHVQLE